MTSARAAYDELSRRLRERALLLSSKAVLEWDEETCMPPAGVTHRGQQIALLAGLAHELLVSPRTAELLAQASAGPSPSTACARTR